jgi:hypothetical protein
MRRPDFFIVGAPKSGTTSLYTYLRLHPEIFMANRKELHFFGSDIQSSYYVRDPQRYLSFFAAAKSEKRAGEASVWYLYSKLAAREIKEFSPRANIIIMLRNPVDMLHSLHSQFLFNKSEDIDDVESALNAEDDRRRGLRVPPAVHFVECLFYRDTVRYAEQVTRYFDAFGKENVHIIIYDDFKNDPSTSYQNTLKFLRVSDNFEPDFTVVNPNKTVHSKALRNVLLNPPEHAQKLLKALVPRFVRANIWKTLKRLNTRYVPRMPMDPALRSRLQAEFVAEVDRLGNLIGRDLTDWGR